MEDKKKLNEEELEKIAGGEYYPDPESILTYCFPCGTPLTMANVIEWSNMMTTGYVKLKCPNCGEEYDIKRY